MLGYRLPRPSTWLPPMLLAAFLLCDLPSIPFLFNAKTRWIFLGVAFAWVLSQKRFDLLFKSRLGGASVLLLLWPLVTVAWSIDPSLSVVKGVGFFIIACTLFAIGEIWAWRQPLPNAMEIFLPLFIVFVLLIAVDGVPTHVATSYETLYTGAGNSNMVGSAAAMCVPLLLWQVFRKPSVSRRWLWWGAVAFIVYILLAVLSRGAIIVACVTALGCILGMGARRRTLWIFFGLVIVIIPLVLSVGVSSRLESYIYQSLIMKGISSHSDIEDSALASRDLPFTEELRAAKAGGVFGGGYGVQIEVGHYVIINDMPIEIAPGTYKREKTNTALALMEEQGVVGLIITLIWWWVFFGCLIRQTRLAPKGNPRLQMGLLTAFLFGMVILSMVEAWWISPASPESLEFWTVAGLAYGLGRRYETVAQAAQGKAG